MTEQSRVTAHQRSQRPQPLASAPRIALASYGLCGQNHVAGDVVKGSEVGQTRERGMVGDGANRPVRYKVKGRHRPEPSIYHAAEWVA